MSCVHRFDAASCVQTTPTASAIAPPAKDRRKEEEEDEG